MANQFLPGWYVLYTRPLHEKKVAFELEKKQVNLFLPTQKVVRQWHDRRKMLDVPLFPSYIFVHLGSLKDYFDSKNIGGVMNYVKFGDEIAKVHEDVIEELRMVLASSTKVEVADYQFDVGQQVKITNGSLNGLSCEVAEYKNERVVVVRIKLLNRIVFATVPSMDLSA
jgi:transcription antitermination factor NusG